MTPQATKDLSKLSYRHQIVMTVIFVAVALLTLLAFVSRASGLSTLKESSAFGVDGTSGSSFQGPSYLALDQKKETLYVLERKGVDDLHSRIQGFDVSSPGTISQIGGQFPLSVPVLDEKPGIFVDNTSLPSAGTIYYMSSASQKLIAFDPSGSMLGAPFPIDPKSQGGPGFYRGPAIDPTGKIWVSNFLSETLDRYTPAGTLDLSVSTKSQGALSSRLAFDTNGDLYAHGYSQDLTRRGSVWKYTAASNYTSSTELVHSSAIDVAVDAQHYLYVLGAHDVAIFDADGNPVYTFAADPSAAYEGIAIDETSGEVFLTDVNSQQVRVFSPTGPLVFLSIGSPSSVGPTHAKLNASVNPEGTSITDCKFEYGTTTNYGQSVPCEGAIPADTSPHPVSATLSGLNPHGAVYHYRLVVQNASGPIASADNTFSTANIASTGVPSAITDSSAVLNGVVTPDTTVITDCKFEYGRTPLYGMSTPCNPPASSIPADLNDHGVNASLSALAAQGTYHYRLVVETASGIFKGDDEVFTTFGPPLVSEEEAAPVTETSATLLAQVNPRESATGYHFEWGTDSSYGHRVPAEGELSAGSGGSAVAASIDISGLTGGATYHFRVVATNASGATEGPDQTFTTFRPNSTCPNAAIRAAQVSSAFPEGTISMPDCMALEKITPQKKFNQRSTGPQFSPGGDRVEFEGEGGLVGTPSLTFVINPYLSTRGPSGWNAQYVLPPADISAGYRGGVWPCAYNSDFSHWVTWGSTDLQSQLGVTIPYRGTVGAAFSPLGPPLSPLLGGIAGNGGTIGAIKEGVCEGTSADATRLFFSIFDAAYLPGDPQPSEIGTSLVDQGNVYEAYLDDEGDPTVRLLQRDGEGNVYGGRCGAQIGGGDGNSRRYRGSVNADASRVYFSLRPSQPEGVTCNKTANKLRIMERVETPDGPEISPLFDSECARISPPCSTADGNDEYEGASQEGERLYFITTRQLADSDLDTTKDLYLYDASRPEGERLTQVSAGDETDPQPGKDAGLLGLADFSGDGSRAYFVAEAALTSLPNQLGRQAELDKPNLYLYQRDAAHPNGKTSFIATLSSGDSSTWGSTPGEKNQARAVPRLGSDVEDLYTGGDGHVLVFVSRAALTADDTDGGEGDIYRYDSLSGLLERVSKADAGGADNGPFSVELATGEARPGAQSVSFNRGVSEDGRTISFNSGEAFVASDSDGKSNDYIWRDGSLTSIPTSTGGSQVSMSGEQVGFGSRAKLLPEDGDAVADGYLLRAGGGFPIIVPAPPCEGEACQGPPSDPPTGQGATSTAPTAGNVKESPRGCKKGSVRRHGKCVKPRAKKHRKHAKRAGHKQGGQK